ncbi:hypothetical protein CC80DRAFT_592129 [Byssothecium circinans]|uniref:Uncharacterized protein n=1 Tax=Byssothecium circinans TaxID=147558 RepID=A0A6A5U3L3_9PLEO|nr:hypothetical protein CC80DRAFT_592129 [Byssothecium circinans]
MALIPHSMVGNCDDFYFVKDSEICCEIVKATLRLRITVGVAPSTSATSTPTTARAGNSTPTPIQNGRVENCRRFYKVFKDEGCWAIANTYSIALGGIPL